MLSPARFDLAVIPCLSCSRDGRRLGHGGGYYDRYLPRMHCPTACLCREALLMEALPVEETDRSVSLVVTESGVYANPGNS